MYAEYHSGCDPRQRKGYTTCSLPSFKEMTHFHINVRANFNLIQRGGEDRSLIKHDRSNETPNVHARQ